MKKLLLISIALCLSTTIRAQIAEADNSYITGTGFDNIVYASGLQADGKLIVGGYFTSYNGTTVNGIARLGTDGTIDPDFTTNIGTGLNAGVLAIAIQSDDKILIGGLFSSFNGTTRYSIARLNADGTLDGTFNSTGTGLNGTVASIAVVASNGSIIVGGDFSSYNGTSRKSIVRLNADGTLDETFDPGTGFNSYVRTIAIQSDEKIIAGGGFTSYNGTSTSNFVRLNTSGTLDGTFSAAGSVTQIYAVAVQADGKILAAGNSGAFGFLTRVGSSGAIDGTFTPPLFNSLIKSLAIQPDGKILAGGYFTNGLIRLSASGVTDVFTGGNGFEGGSYEINTITVQSDGKVISGGAFVSYYGVAKKNIARLRTCTTVSITTPPASKAICEGDNASFNVIASGTGLTFQWQVNTNNGIGIYSNVTDDGVYSGAATATLAITGATAGMSSYLYRCIVQDASCLNTSALASLTVNALQVITADPLNSSVCEGTNTTFSATVTGGFGGYQWQENQGSGFANLSNGGIYSGVTGTTLTLTGVTASMNGFQYRLVASLCSPPVSSASATLTVNLNPVITQQPASVYQCFGNGNLEFTVEALGEGLSYQWQGYVGSPIYADLSDGANAGSANIASGTYSGVHTTSLSIADAPANFPDSYIYKVKVKTASNCAIYSAVASARVYNEVSFTSQPSDVSLCASLSGETVFNITTGLGSAPVPYQWQMNNGSGFVNLENSAPYSGVLTRTLHIANSGITTDMSGYKFRCLVGDCQTEHASFEAELIVDSRPSVISQSDNVTVCQNETAKFSVEASGPGVQYQWQQNTGLGFVNIEDDDTFFGSQSNELSISNVGGSFNGRNYRCVLSTEKGLCSEVNVAPRKLSVVLLPNITTQPVGKTVCEGASTTLSFSVENTSTTYQWQADVAGDGNFVDLTTNETYLTTNSRQLTIQNIPAALNGNKFRCRIGTCTPESFTDVVTLKVNALPSIITSPVAQTICQGGTAAFAVEAGGSELNYQWTVNGSALSDGDIYSGTKTSTLTLTNVTSAVNEAAFVCSVSNSCASPLFSNEAHLTVQPASVAIIRHPSTAQVCSGEEATFSIDAGTNTVVYQWQESNETDFHDLTEDGNYSGVNTANLSISNISSSQSSQKYRCVVSTSCQSGTSNQAISESAELVVTNPIVISSHPINVSECGGTDVVFFVDVSSGDDLTYQWQEDSGEGFTDLTTAGVYSNVNTASLTLSGVTSLLDGRSYRCVLGGGCQGTISNPAQLQVTNPPKPEITINASNPEAIILQTEGGDSYEWFKNGVTITGATSADHIVTVDGSYTVRVTKNGCLSEMSEPKQVVITSVEGSWGTSEMKLYPNPVFNTLAIQFDRFDSNQPVSISVIDMTGRTVKSYTTKGQATITMEVDTLHEGKYFAVVKQHNKTTVVRFIKLNQ
jgi:uncharacterized delta-60 repeat protein